MTYKPVLPLDLQEQYKLKQKVFGEMRSLTNAEFEEFYKATGKEILTFSSPLFLYSINFPVDEQDVCLSTNLVNMHLIFASLKIFS